MLKQFLFKSYRFFYLWETWWRRRFTTAGLFILFIVITSAVLGVDTTANMIYQIFIFALILLLTSIFWSFFFRINCNIKRDLPRFVTVGEKFRYKIDITNNTSKLEKELSLFENPKDPRPTFDELINSREPGEESRNLWDRKTLYYRWLWLIRKKQKAWFGQNYLPDIPPHNTISYDAELTPGNRGYMNFSGVIISRPDPFKLFMGFKRIDCKQKILVLPKRYNLPNINLPGSRKFHSGGVALASSIGNSEEFVSLREFRPGDPIRNIHWKSWAKAGELIVKEYQDEFFSRHALILDTYHKEEHSVIFEEAVSIASSFACSLESEESILDLMFVGDQAFRFSSGRGLATSEKMLEILSCVKTNKEKNIIHLLPLVEKYSQLLSGSICIFLKWDDHRKRIIDFLKCSGTAVIVLIVTNDRAKYENEVKDYDNINIIETGNIQEDLMKI